MSFRPCALCEKRVPGKLASLYWAYWREDDVRSAWRQATCMACLTETFLPLLLKCNGDSMDGSTCLGCGGSLATDLVPVFLTLYLPKQEPREFEMAMCAACAAHLQVSMQRGAEKLPDRRGAASSPTPNAPDAWAALGL